MGLEVNGRPLLRAYSMASANHEEEPRILQHQGPGRPADLEAAEASRRAIRFWSAAMPTGTLIARQSALPAHASCCCRTGTGLAPFASLIKDPGRL